MAGGNGGWIDRVNAQMGRRGDKKRALARGRKLPRRVHPRCPRDSILSDRDKRFFFHAILSRLTRRAEVHVIVGVSKHCAGLVFQTPTRRMRDERMMIPSH